MGTAAKGLVPTGRLLKLVWRDEGQEGNPHHVLKVVFDSPDGRMEHHFNNTGWHIDNPALQFLAGVDYKPSDIDGTVYDARDDRKGILIAQRDDGSWAVSQEVLNQGEEALRQADWFESEDGSVEVEVQ